MKRIFKILIITFAILGLMACRVMPVHAAFGDVLLNTPLGNYAVLRTEGSNGTRVHCAVAYKTLPGYHWKNEYACWKQDELPAILAKCIPYTKAVKVSALSFFSCLPWKYGLPINAVEKSLVDKIVSDTAPAWRVKPNRSYPTRPVHNVNGKTIGRIAVGTKCHYDSTAHKHHVSVTMKNGVKGFAVCEFK